MARSVLEDRDSSWQPVELELPVEAPSPGPAIAHVPRVPRVVELDNGTDSEPSARVIIIDLG